MVIDVGAVLAGLYLTQHLVGMQDQTVPLLYRGIALVTLLAILAVQGLYGRRERRRRWSRFAGAAGLTLAVSMAAHWLTGTWTVPAILVVWSLALTISLSLRMLYDYCLRLVFGFDPITKRVLFVGSPEAWESFGASWDSSATAEHGTRTVGLVSDREPSPSWPHDRSVRCLGLLDELEDIVRRARPDELVIVDPDIERARLTEIVELCRRRRLSLKLSNLESRFSRTSTCAVEGCDAPVFVAGPGTTRGVAWFVKRCSDVVVAAALLVLTAPLFAAAAVAVKLSSPGPVFFADERIGLGEKVFRCYKFRTMRTDARQMQAELEALNEADGAIFKLRNDPRVTPVGRLMRKVSLDELPQLYNVLRGDMSLVGPRPLPLRDNRLMDGTAKRRHVVLPGITGMWQVAGRSDTSFDDMIALDFAYIDTWSIWLDLRIIVKTFGAVVASRGAY